MKVLGDGGRRVTCETVRFFWWPASACTNATASIELVSGLEGIQISRPCEQMRYLWSIFGGRALEV